MKTKGNILVVDDNTSILKALDMFLGMQFEGIQTLKNPNQIISTLQQESFDVVLLDMNFSAGVNTGNEGLYWLDRILELRPDISVVMLTAYGDVDLAVRALKKGAIDFILKPWDNNKLLATLKSACNLHQSKKEIVQLKKKEKQLISELSPPALPVIGSSTVMNEVTKTVEKVAATNANILITGENGTGKEVIARELHRLSERKRQIMTTVDMGAIAETLFESELFGHLKGAFTDANEDRIGKIETANGGTLFLDEIGNLPLAMQSKLLSVLQNRKVTRVGDSTPTDIDIRLICATNCKLDQMVESGDFREDLLYRINTITIELPPLRDRGNDIIELAKHFLSIYTKKYNKPKLKLSAQAEKKLLSHQWPGNIRELQHAIEKAVILSDSDSLTKDDFLFRAALDTPVTQGIKTLEELEKLAIEAAMKRHAGKISAVAEELGITRQTLYNKMKK